ncbi:MAG: FAD-dependent oxidoreductase [Clostridia bacterium]
MQKTDFWAQSKQAVYPVLRGRRSADAVVVGGGLSGLSIALWLCKAGLRVTLLEARTLGSGATACCGGRVSLTNGLFYERLERMLGQGVTNAYGQTQQGAFRALAELVREQGEAALWLDQDMNLLGGAGKETALLEKEAEAMHRAGVACACSQATQSPFPAATCILLRDMAVLQPMAHVRFLARKAEALGLVIFEQSRVTALETNQAYTEHGSILAPYLIIATGYPVVNTPGRYFLRLVQRQSYLMKLTDCVGFHGMYGGLNGEYALSKDKGGALFQLNDGLVGTQQHENIEKRFMSQFAPYLECGEPAQVLGGIEAYSADGLPYIGTYSKNTPNLFVAAGYGGRGLIGSMVAAQAICAKVLGLPSEEYEIYSGQRKQKRVLYAQARVSAHLGARYVRGFLRPQAPRCPHLGCKLVYRPKARLWECPCHGSRFDDIGHVLNAPAVHDAVIHRRKK